VLVEMVGLVLPMVLLDLIQYFLQIHLLVVVAEQEIKITPLEMV
jgi:hypothetical protein